MQGIGANSDMLSGLLGDAGAAASLFGNGEYKSEMESLWKMMDDMAANDPEAYDKFMKKQMKGHADMINADRKEREFLPEPGFVIQVPLESVEATASMLQSHMAEGMRNPASLKPGSLVAEIFVNVCHTTNIVTPVITDKATGTEREIKKDALDADWDNASCSVSYGERRVDKKNRVIIDVVVHSWVAMRSRKNLRFKQFVAFFVLDLVLDKETKLRQKNLKDKKLQFRPQVMVFPKLLYKGGKEAQMHALEPKSLDKRFAKEIPSGGKSTAASSSAKAKAKQQPKSAVDVVMPSRNQAEEARDDDEPLIKELILPGQQQQPKAKKSNSLIQEVGADASPLRGSSLIQDVSSSSTPKPVESKPIESKPIESKPILSKPIPPKTKESGPIRPKSNNPSGGAATSNLSQDEVAAEFVKRSLERQRAETQKRQEMEQELRQQSDSKSKVVVNRRAPEPAPSTSDWAKLASGYSSAVPNQIREVIAVDPKLAPVAKKQAASSTPPPAAAQDVSWIANTELDIKSDTPSCKLTLAQDYGIGIADLNVDVSLKALVLSVDAKKANGVNIAETERVVRIPFGGKTVVAEQCEAKWRGRKNMLQVSFHDLDISPRESKESMPGLPREPSSFVNPLDRPGALESLLHGPRTETVALRLFSKMAELFVRDPSSACGLMKEGMGRNCFVDAYAHRVMSGETVNEWLLDATERIQDTPNVKRLCVPVRGRLNIVGDTHGQLADVFWIFFKYGTPTEKNIYVFNGDICDRGGHAIEIFMLLWAFQRWCPNSIYILRGNHEDEYCNLLFGFMAELRTKFGLTTGTDEDPNKDNKIVGELYNNFQKYFAELPLYSLIDGVAGLYSPSKPPVDIAPNTEDYMALTEFEIDVHASSRRVRARQTHSAEDHPQAESPVAWRGKMEGTLDRHEWQTDPPSLKWSNGEVWYKLGGQVFVVHGGIPMGLQQNPKQNVAQRYIPRVAELQQCDFKRKIPSSANTPDNSIMFTSLWSDPYEAGSRPEGRGVPWGPPESFMFCQTNWLHGIIRSHQLPRDRRGFQMMHDQLVLTVFSASNYCGTSRNAGGIIVYSPWTFPGFDVHTVREFYSPGFEGLNSLLQDYVFASRGVRELVADAYEEDLSGFCAEQREADEEVVQYIRQVIVWRKLQLWEGFREVDTERTGLIPTSEFVKVCGQVISPHLPWSELLQLLEADVEKNLVAYVPLLLRFQLKFQFQLYGPHTNWQHHVIKHLYRETLKKELPVGEVLTLFDIGGNNLRDFNDALNRLGAPLSYDQAVSLYQSLDQMPLNTIKAGRILGQQNTTNERFLVAFSMMFLALGALPFANAPNWGLQLVHYLGERILAKHASLLSFYQTYDQSQNGVMSKHDFIFGMKDTIGEGLEAALGRCGVPTDSPSAPSVDTHLELFADCLDINSSGKISFLELLHIMVPRVDAGLADPILEQLCRTIYFNRAPLQVCLSRFDKQHTGRCSSRQLKLALRALSSALSNPGEEPKIPDDQIDHLIRGLKFRKGTLNYEKFLASFEIIDTRAGAESKRDPTAQRDYRTETQTGAQILNATVRLAHMARSMTPSSASNLSTPDLSPISRASASLQASPGNLERQFGVQAGAASSQVLVMSDGGQMHLRDFKTTPEGHVRVRRTSATNETDQRTQTLRADSNALSSQHGSPRNLLQPPNENM